MSLIPTAVATAVEQGTEALVRLANAAERIADALEASVDRAYKDGYDTGKNHGGRK